MSAVTPIPTWVLDAKHNPPTSAATQAPRPRLFKSLISEPGVRLVLFRAPAGFGKTTAMQQLRCELEQQGIANAWITLDRADNDVARFLPCLSEAISPLFSKSGKTQGSTVSTMQLIERLQQHNRPFVLFFDEYEVIRDEGVHSVVREVLESLPRHGKLVIGSRASIPFGLGRLRARGQIVELDAESLRFSLEEAREYLTIRRGISLSDEDLLRLYRKTEGWIAGLWLASAALVRVEQVPDFISRFSGSNLEVAEYLSDDVLNHQPADMRQFLLHTSVLRSLNPALCQTLLPHFDCIKLLSKLESENILISRIGGDDLSYRYHSLFGSFLRAQLSREDPESLARLHKAASCWYEEQGRPVPAIEHAFEAGDTGSVIRLLLQHGMTLLHHGRMRMLTRWFDALPQEAIASQPPLLIMQAWAVCCTRGASKALVHLQASGLEASSDTTVQAHLTALWPVLLALLDRIEDAYSFGKKNLTRLPTGDQFADVVVLAVLAEMCSAKGDTRESHRLLDLLRSSVSGSLGALNDMFTQSAEGVIALLEGRQKEAATRFRIAVSAHVPDDATLTHGNAWAGVLYASSVYEANDIEQALSLLRVYLPVVREVGMPDHLIMSYRMLARISSEQGSLEESFHLLADLEAIGHRRELPRVVASAQLERSRLQLLQGHFEAAREELVRASEHPVWELCKGLRLPANDIDDPLVASMRWEVFAGDAAAAANSLYVEEISARQQRRLLRALKLQMLRALALHRSGQSESAFELTESMLRQCWQDGFVRQLVDEGEQMGVLVRDSLERMDGSSQGQFEAWLHRLVQSFGSLPPSEVAPQVHRKILDDPLTPQEMKILNLLAEGHPNKRIADRLDISDSTVRTHLRSINNKLRVRSRLQAVAMGKACGLLP